MGRQKLGTIRALEDIEGGLRKRLEDSSLRVSQIEEAIGSLRKQRTLSRASLTASRGQEAPTLITTIESDLLRDDRYESHSDSPERVSRLRRPRDSTRFQSYRYPL